MLVKTKELLLGNWDWA